ncbi:unnamed protein product [Kuraishia capsulata CBS 1993]|uniref:Uncharacterized protein n=1 Tax=Kuraishia capsulata CBS 1993 TaxID=1382522 RepID=W6MT40_9ASCO|nr:uncharacterized protein KUCA_T00000902001 [Kuraishia capsulata CBS 1993]CDK24935.1 unnamed protein product [Kuraishia capsulata CBS 1993]
MAASLKAPPRPLPSKRFGKEMDIVEQPQTKKFCAAGLASAMKPKDLELYTRQPPRNRSLSPTDISDKQPQPQQQQPQQLLTKPQPQLVDNPQQRKHELENNVDYIALCSVLTLLKSQRRLVQEDIRRLNRTQTRALKDPHAFVESLKSRKEKLPAPAKVPSLPPIQWSKYGFSKSELIQNQIKKGISQCKCSKSQPQCDAPGPGDHLMRSYRLFDKR